MVIDFVVEQADLNMLDKAPGDDGKVDPASEVPFPVPLDQVQGMLNVTATLQPDGSVSAVSGKSDSPLKLDIGFDLRKLFLMTMPIIFPGNAVKTSDTWPVMDGLLGKKEAKNNITYTNHLIEIAPKDQSVVFTIGQDAQNVIDAKIDKDGKSADTDANAVKSTSGKATLTGKVKFLAQPSSDKPDHYIGRISEGTLTMNANIVTKQLKPDPNNPDDPKETTIDIKGRFFIVADDKAKPAGASAKTSPTRTAANHGSRKVALQ
jgi:hypothetical protein